MLNRLANKSYCYRRPLGADHVPCGGGTGSPGLQPPNSWVTEMQPGGAPRLCSFYDAVTAPGAGGFVLLLFCGGRSVSGAARSRASLWRRYAPAAAAVILTALGFSPSLAASLRRLLVLLIGCGSAAVLSGPTSFRRPAAAGVNAQGASPGDVHERLAALAARASLVRET